MKHVFKDVSWRKLFITQEGEFVIGQKPNLPAWVWISATAAAYLFEPFAEAFMSIAYGAGAVWAFLEMRSGVNAFRRIIGGVVFFIVALLIAGKVIIG